MFDSGFQFLYCNLVFVNDFDHSLKTTDESCTGKQSGIRAGEIHQHIVQIENAFFIAGNHRKKKRSGKR